MYYSTINLPEEVVLLIFNYISHWNDRLQFVTTCRDYWNCITKIASMREVDLLAEKNLLKFKLARSIILNPNISVTNYHSRAVNSIKICQNLQLFVVRDQLVSSSLIAELVKAAANSHSNVHFVVPSTTVHSWKKILNKQNFKAGTVTISCEIDNDKEHDTFITTNKVVSTYNVEDFIASEGYQPCNIEPLSESYIIKNLDSTITSTGHLFAGCIVYFEKVKFLITSFDAFVHIENADDCSFNNKWMNKKPFSKLHQKFEKGRNFFELSVILHGCIELLAVGGLVVITEKPVDAFLGSSVKSLKGNLAVDGDCFSSNIYTSKQSKEVVRSERLMRQYFKNDSCNLWSFHLKTTHNLGFFPISPIHAEDHPSVSSISLTLQSFILNSFAEKHTDDNKLQMLLCRMKDEDFMKKKLKLERFNGDNFDALHDKMTGEGKWKEMIKILMMLESKQVSFGNSKKDIVANKKNCAQCCKQRFSESAFRFK